MSGLTAIINISFKDKFVESVSQEREEASNPSVHDMWPSLALVFSPLVRHVEVWHCGPGWCSCSRKVPELNSHVEIAPPPPPSPASKLSILWTLSSYCVHCLCTQLLGDIWEAMSLPAQKDHPCHCCSFSPDHYRVCRATFRRHSARAGCLLLRNHKLLQLFHSSHYVVWGRVGQEVRVCHTFTR